MRAVTVAAVQVAPSPEPLTSASIADNTLRAVALIRRCHEATGAELIVLPESVTTGFTPGVDLAQLWELVSDLPGPLLDPFTEVAAELGVHLVLGTYRRGSARYRRAQRSCGDRRERNAPRDISQDASVRRRAGRPGRLGDTRRRRARR